MSYGKIDDCRFCDIANGRAEGHIVFKDDVSLSFLDRRPLFPGHCLLAPREHYETVADLPADLVEPIFKNMQLLARAVEEATGAEGCFVAINNRVSQSIPHLHIHIVPRRRNDGLKGFFWPRHPYRDSEEILKVRDAIRSAVKRIMSGEKK